MAEDTGPMRSQTIPEEYISKESFLRRKEQEEDATKGVATDYWLELVAYPKGTARSLWLKVDGRWCHHHNPDEGTQNAVIQAFNQLDKHEVMVWYHRHGNHGAVVGMVVCSK